MVDRTFSYDGSDFLNDLVANLKTEDVRVSIVVRPDVPELRDFWENYHDGSVATYRRVEEICRAVGVRPFVGLLFKHQYGDNIKPEVAVWGPDWSDMDGNPELKELNARLHHPTAFAGQGRWYKINFGEMSTPEQIGGVKGAVRDLESNGYIVTDVHSVLNPRSYRIDCYSDGERNEGTMHAHGGNLLIRTEGPGMQSLPNFLSGSDADIKRLTSRLKVPAVA